MDFDYCLPARSTIVLQKHPFGILEGSVRFNHISGKLLLAALVFLPAVPSFGQGCIISRSGLESSGMEGGYLRPGDWTTSFGFRHVYSHVHFSGPTENFSRAQLGTEVQSKTNLDDVVVNYQVTPRIGLTATLPFLYASRRQQSQYATLYTSGISDVSIGGNYWVRKPGSEQSGVNNAQFGLSLLIPSGNDRQSNVVATSYGATPTTQYPDYSVQPGGGSWGMVMTWRAFQGLGNHTTAFIDGDYVMTQGGHHDFWTSHGGTTNSITPAVTAGMTQFDAIQDQYMVEIGASHPAPGIRGLEVSLMIRDEGVPARNLIGNDLGFKRPGFGVALTPGFSYTHGHHSFQFTVGKVLIRDRTKSVAEKTNGVHEGDAAFANYVWMAGYTIRMPGRKTLADESAHNAPGGMPDTINAHAASQTGAFKPFNLKTLDGTRKTLEDFSNKLTLVSFFYPRCPYCNAELPLIQELYNRYKDRGLSVVWINVLPEETGLIANWQHAKNLNVPVLVGASQGSLQRDYHIVSTPATFLLDEKGRVLLHAEGYKPGDEKALEAKIEQSLAGAVPAAPISEPAPSCLPAGETGTRVFTLPFSFASNRPM
jgi:peroxiredoxin